MWLAPNSRADLQALESLVAALAEKPRFYNTLTENCTNALAYIVNDIVPRTLPYDISWQLTGYADLYLMKQGFITLTDNSKEATLEAYDLTMWKSEIQGEATENQKEFSAFEQEVRAVTFE